VGTLDGGSDRQLVHDGQHANIPIGMACGSRCGSWGLALLQRTGDRWLVTQFIVDRWS